MRTWVRVPPTLLTFGDRLTVGLLTLNQATKVRSLLPELTWLCFAPNRGSLHTRHYDGPKVANLGRPSKRQQRNISPRGFLRSRCRVTPMREAVRLWLLP